MTSMSTSSLSIVSFIGIPLYLINYVISSYSRTLRWLISAHQVLKVLYLISFYIVSTVSIIYLIMGIIAYFKPKIVSRSLPYGDEPFVTIQIPTYNELAAINCARCCLNFDYPRDKMQIIIGDDSNDPSISAQIDEFAAKYPEIIMVTRRGNNIGFKPGNLNHMLKYTKGEFIAIFDSDFLPPRDFLRKAMQPFQGKPDLAAVQARWHITNLSQNVFSLLGGITSYVTHHIAIPFMQKIGGSAFLCGSAHVTRKSHIEMIGNWRVGALTEDIEASLELIKRGKRITYLEDVLVDCEAPFTFKDLLLQQKRWASGNITAFKRNLLNVWKSKKITLKEKISASIFSTGYIYPYFLLFLSIWGIISQIIPNPISPPFNLLAFILSTIGSILLTSGALISSSMVLIKKKQGRLIPKLIGGTLTVGMGLLIYVNIGIYSGLFNRKIPWYMVQKNGNSLVSSSEVSK